MPSWKHQGSLGAGALKQVSRGVFETHLKDEEEQRPRGAEEYPQTEYLCPLLLGPPYNPKYY